MSKQFKEQGGAATMDPSRFRRWLTSKLMTVMSSEARQQKLRRRAERARKKNGAPHRVEYFHQVDDGYSHLAAQVLEKLTQRYDIQLKCHLVTGPMGANSPEPDLLLKLSRYDARQIAPYYGLWFPEHPEPLQAAVVAQTQSILAAYLRNHGSAAFASKLAEVGQAMWSSNQAIMDSLGRELGPLDEPQTQQILAEGNRRRAELKHYSGGMFYYGGEWYWGVDRLYHLEQRLSELGLDRSPSEPLIAPRPVLETGPLHDSGRLTLEIYPSLRSPYTAIVFDQAVALAKQTGVALKMLPVLPMVMRGVPATREKGSYILFDTGREARAAGVPFGPCYDPIGEPTRRAYSLLAWAKEQGKELEFFSSFIRRAWVEAINTNTDRGLCKVVEGAGLDWADALQIVDNHDWQAVIEANRLQMYELGLWGVPSFRLLDYDGTPLLALWGQDRLWIMASKIQQVLAQHAEDKLVETIT